MGSEQSTQRQQQERHDELRRALAQERSYNERRTQQLVAEATAAARIEAQLAARREAESIVRREEQARADAVAKAEAKAREESNAELLRVSTQESVATDRPRAPYQYTNQELQNRNVSSPTTSSSNLYPNMSEIKHSFQRTDNSQNANRNDFVFVDNRGQVAGYRPTPSAPPASRDRSVSRNRSTNARDDEVNCPTCSNMFTLAIYQCSNGHSSCSSCKAANRRCGKCCQNITDMRNFALEGYIAERHVPCGHSKDGCCLRVKISDLESHMKECPFKEQQCPLTIIFGYCPWKGHLKQLSIHFDNAHSNYKANVGSEMRITNFGATYRHACLLVLSTFNFLFQIKVLNNTLYMAVQLIGTKISAAKWSYEIHIYNKSDSRRKYTYTDTCSSNNDGIHNIFSGNDCAVLPVSYAKTFTNNNILTYKLFIKMNEKPKGNFKANRGGKGGKNFNN